MDNDSRIRVLHVLGTTNIGGAESRIMELYRAVDRDKIQFDFLVHTSQDGSYSDEIRALGGKIYTLPRFKVYNYFRYRKAVRDFFEKHTEFCAVHGHMTSTASIYLPVAKKIYAKNNIKRSGHELITIAHARSAGVDRGIKGIITKLIRKNLKNKADVCFTCSREAGIAVYGKKSVEEGRVWTVPNAINCSRFKFDKNVRTEVREKLGLTDKFVLGHVGRFGFMKNHVYLAEIFAHVCRKNPDSALVLIGKGEEEETVREKIKRLGEEMFGDSDFLEKRTFFLGNRFDIEAFYQAFDCFVFPSIFEGFPGSVLEAEASGLPCFVSDKVTGEVALSDNVYYLSIDEKPEKWAERIILSSAENDLDKRINENDAICEAISKKGFDVESQADEMERFYRSGANPPGYRTV